MSTPPKRKNTSNNLAWLGLLLIFFSGTHGVCQGRLQDGFIITNDSDTIKGQIVSRSNAKNYKSCLFQNHNGSVSYTASQIKGFGYQDGQFFASNVINSHFVEVLVIGDLSLYKFEDHYYLEKLKSLYKLDSRDLLVMINGTLTTQEHGRWKGVVDSLTNDCLSNEEKLISKLNFTEKSLTKIVVAYNGCKSGGAIIVKDSDPWTNLRIGASIGLIKSDVKITDDRFGSPNFLPDSYHEIDPTFGLIMIMSFPRIYDGFALQSEIQFTKSYYSELITRNSMTEFHDTSIELSTLSIPLAFRYSFPKKVKDLTFSVYGGINYDHHVKAKTERLSERISRNVVSTFPKAPAFEVNKNQLGFLGGMDILKSFSKMSSGISIRYARSPDLSKSAGFRANTHRVILSLIFLKK